MKINDLKFTQHYLLFAKNKKPYRNFALLFLLNFILFSFPPVAFSQAVDPHNRKTSSEIPQNSTQCEGAHMIPYTYAPLGREQRQQHKELESR